MILDALLQVCSAQQVTASAVSENTVDFGNVTPKRNIATGVPMAYVAVLTAEGTNTGSVKLQAIQSAAADLSSPQIIGELDLATADMVVGKAYIVPLSQGIPALRYHGMQFTITGTVDATFDAFGPMDARDPAILAETYAKGYVV